MTETFIRVVSYPLLNPGLPLIFPLDTIVK
jgi:hypothetical protein